MNNKQELQSCSQFRSFLLIIHRMEIIVFREFEDWIKKLLEAIQNLHLKLEPSLRLVHGSIFVLI